MANVASLPSQIPSYAESYHHLEHQEEKKKIHFYFTDSDSSEEFSLFAKSVLPSKMSLSCCSETVHFDPPKTVQVVLDYSKVDQSADIYKSIEPLLETIPKARQDLNELRSTLSSDREPFSVMELTETFTKLSTDEKQFSARDYLNRIKQSLIQEGEKITQQAIQSKVITVCSDSCDEEEFKSIFEDYLNGFSWVEMFPEQNLVWFTFFIPNAKKTSSSEHIDIEAYKDLLYPKVADLIFAFPKNRDISSLQFLKEYIKRDDEGNFQYKSLSAIKREISEQKEMSLEEKWSKILEDARERFEKDLDLQWDA